MSFLVPSKDLASNLYKGKSGKIVDTLYFTDSFLHLTSFCKIKPILQGSWTHVVLPQFQLHWTSWPFLLYWMSRGSPLAAWVSQVAKRSGMPTYHKLSWSKQQVAISGGGMRHSGVYKHHQHNSGFFYHTVVFSPHWFLPRMKCLQSTVLPLFFPLPSHSSLSQSSCFWFSHSCSPHPCTHTF